MNGYFEKRLSRSKKTVLVLWKMGGGEKEQMWKEKDFHRRGGKRLVECEKFVEKR